MYIPRAPTIPPSTNNDSGYSRIAQVSTLQVLNYASFFGTGTIGQQSVYGTVGSIAMLLQRLGLAAPGYVNDEGPLAGVDASGDAAQGVSVSLSTDGTTLAVGGFGDASGTGATWIFTKGNGIWTQQTAKLVGSGATGNAAQGQSVALSADGNTLAVGGWEDNSFVGATWIFTRTNSTWSQQGSKLVGTGSVGDSAQGTAVSLSADGNTLAVSGNGDDNNVGATWIFTRSGSTWTQQGSKLVGSGYVGECYQGYGLALSLDGNTLAVGGYDDNSGVGATWIFTRSGSTWTQQGSKLVGTGATGLGRQGYSVSLKVDTVVVGGYYDNSQAGATWVFKRSGTTWTQVGSKLVGTGATEPAGQGSSVSINDDEDILVTSGYADNDFVGALWVFKLINGVWTQYHQKLTPIGYNFSSTPELGSYNTTISISGDGETIAAGGPANSNDVGATWTFVGFNG